MERDGRRFTRVVLVLFCVVVLIVSASVLPALPGERGTTVPSPMDGVRDPESDAGSTGANAAAGGQSTGNSSSDGGSLPDSAEATASGGDSDSAGSRGGGDGSENRTGGAAGSGSQSSGSGQALGALNAGSETTVGGDRSTENESSPFAKQSQRIHFVVESSRPSYWRTAAFDRYTGSGWTSTASARPYDGGVLPRQGARDEAFTHRVTLRRPTTTLPTAWRPVRLRDAPPGTTVTDERSLSTRTAVAPNTSYAVRGFAPPRDPARLERAGTQYPAAVESRYTRVPDATPDRVRRFTRDLTREADSPYETAVRIESWLESNKEYSLNASHDPERDVASAFLFEMDRGYCEYFATTMTVMLRSQDIPARYVVGYSTGQPVDDSTYVVRGMNAHAWVEVYFPEVGWVRFDPTPGGERLSSETRSFASSGAPDDGTGGEQLGGDAPGQSQSQGQGQGQQGGNTLSTRADSYTHTEEGSPGETFGQQSSTSSSRPEQSSSSESDSSESDDSADQSSAESQSTQTPSGEPAPGYAVSVDQSPLVPGTTVTATVTRDDEPVAGVRVFFDDEPVGATDADGNVTGTVPHESSLTVSVGSPPAERLGSPPLAGTTARAYSVVAPSATALRAVGSSPRAATEANFSVATDGALSVDGTPFPGATVTVTATIRDQPIRGATIERNGTVVGETNATGAVTTTLPTDRSETVFTASRGDVSAATNVSLVTDLSVAVDGRAFPGRDVQVSVTANGTAVPGARIDVGNSTGLATTNRTGVATVTVPAVVGNVTLGAKRGVATATTRVEIDRLTVEAEPRSPIPFAPRASLPWAPVRVTTRLDENATGGVAVDLNGRPVGETGPDGRLTATLPPAGHASVTATGYGQTARASAGRPLVGLAGLVGSLALLVGVVVRGTRRHGTAGAARHFLPRLRRVVFTALISASERLAHAATALRRALRRVRADVGALPAVLQAARRRAAAWVTAAGRRLRDRGRSALSWLRSSVTSLRQLRSYTLRELLELCLDRLLRPTGRSAAGPAGGGPGPAERVRASGGPEQRPELTIREAWDRFVRQADVSQRRTKTPGEVAEHAIAARNLPPDAVRTLRDAFRAVEYGHRSAADELDGARRALDSIEQRSSSGDSNSHGGSR